MQLERSKTQTPWFYQPLWVFITLESLKVTSLPRIAESPHTDWLCWRGPVSPVPTVASSAYQTQMSLFYLWSASHRAMPTVSSHRESSWESVLPQDRWERPRRGTPPPRPLPQSALPPRARRKTCNAAVLLPPWTPRLWGRLVQVISQAVRLGPSLSKAMVPKQNHLEE